MTKSFDIRLRDLNKVQTKPTAQNLAKAMSKMPVSGRLFFRYCFVSRITFTQRIYPLSSQAANHANCLLYACELLSFITGCAVAQHCYNSDVIPMGKLELWPPVKFKPLNSLSQNLSQLIKSTRGTFFPSLVIRSRRTSGQIGEMSLSCDFLIFFWGTRRDQTLWPMLMHAGSKCVKSRKDVPFGG